MSKPTVGRIVHVLMDPRENNGADVAPAIITRVWAHESLDSLGLPRYSVNVRVLSDTSANPELRTSIYLFERRLTEEQLDELYPTIEARKLVAFWPPTVA
jgi:hypothetical protein